MKVLRMASDQFGRGLQGRCIYAAKIKIVMICLNKAKKRRKMSFVAQYTKAMGLTLSKLTM